MQPHQVGRQPAVRAELYARSANDVRCALQHSKQASKKGSLQMLMRLSNARYRMLQAILDHMSYAT